MAHLIQKLVSPKLKKNPLYPNTPRERRAIIQIEISMLQLCGQKFTLTSSICPTLISYIAYELVVNLTSLSAENLGSIEYMVNSIIYNKKKNLAEKVSAIEVFIGHFGLSPYADVPSKKRYFDLKVPVHEEIVIPYAPVPATPRQQKSDSFATLALFMANQRTPSGVLTFPVFQDPGKPFVSRTRVLDALKSADLSDSKTRELVATLSFSCDPKGLIEEHVPDHALRLLIAKKSN